MINNMWREVTYILDKQECIQVINVLRFITCNCRYRMPIKALGDITYAGEMESNLIPHFAMGVIMYPCWH